MRSGSAGNASSGAGGSARSPVVRLGLLVVVVVGVVLLLSRRVDEGKPEEVDAGLVEKHERHKHHMEQVAAQAKQDYPEVDPSTADVLAAANADAEARDGGGDSAGAEAAAEPQRGASAPDYSVEDYIRRVNKLKRPSPTRAAAGARMCPQSLIDTFGHRGAMDNWGDLDLNNGNSFRSKATKKLMDMNPGRVTRLKDFRSLGGEEVWMLHRFWGNPIPEGKTYIEIGAVDGRLFSNTIALDKSWHWKGLLVEGSTKNALKLANNRPDAFTVHAAVCSEPGTLTFYGSGPQGHAEKSERRVLRGRMLKRDNTPHEVACGPMSDYEHQAGLTDVAMFIVDVEGAEEVVINTHDWQRVPVNVLMTEALADEQDIEKNKQVRQTLVKHGMCLLAQRVGHWNEVWLNEWFWTQTPNPTRSWPPSEADKAIIWQVHQAAQRGLIQ